MDSPGDDAPGPSLLDDEEGSSFEERVYLEFGLDVLRKLGQGGMGVVFEAEEPRLDRRVALKVLKDEHRDSPAMRRRFLDEARVGGRLQHPGLVPVYNIGEIDGLPFFTMRLIGGQTLAGLLRDRPELTWSVGVFLQVSQTLAYAHDRGVVHRDVKPANIMVGDFGEVHLVDWGLAQLIGGHESWPVGGAGVAGTPAYMSPEQASGSPTARDQRADVFGLGATLCEILTGLPPYRGGSREEVMSKARECNLAGALKRLKSCEAAPELKALARACLSADPADRPAHAGEVAARLLDYQAGVQKRLKEAEEARVRTAIRAVEERRRWALSLVLLLVCSFAGAVLYSEHERAARASAETARSVADAIEESSRLRQRGRSLDARSAHRKAEGLLARSDPAVKARFSPALADLAMLARLDDIRYFPSQLGPGRLLPAEASAAYDAAFQAYGINVPAGPDERTAGLVRSSPLRVELVSALDDWGRISPDPAARKRLRAISEAADPDPAGPAGQLRRALAKPDREALGSLARSLPASGPPAPVLASLGAALREHRAVKESAEVLRAARRSHPDDFWINLELAATLTALKPEGSDEGRAYLTAALSMSRDNPAVPFYLASALQNAGRLDAAVSAYHEAISLRPDYPEAYCNLGNTLTQQKKLDEAVASFRKAIELRPGYALAYFNLGFALDEQGKFAEAFDAYGEAVKHREGYVEAHSNRGLAAYRLGRFSDAIPAFEAGLAKMPNDHPLWATFEPMLKMARSLAPLEPKLEGVLKLEETSKVPVDDLLGMARLCGWPGRSRHAEAARLYAEVFARKPELAEDLVTGDRYAASGAAAMAGAGEPARAADPSLARWRNLALGWLRADLEKRRIQLDEAGSNQEARHYVLLRLGYWSRDPSFAGVRGQDAIARLPEAERPGWQKLWDDLKGLIQAKPASSPAPTR
ncbi:protein kinase domain-containing protein [Singulisphaera sp. PoT]|uniref:protein kinase domain-containing protein n=1 Tax=Singulisphaera sp. PoT TaxID=3411797 RepID=UPI003BF4F6BA